MGNLKVWVEPAAVVELLRSQEMENAVREVADGVCSRAGSGYEVTTSQGKDRVVANVSTATREAVRDNYRNNTLIKALKS